MEESLLADVVEEDASTCIGGFIVLQISKFCHEDIQKLLSSLIWVPLDWG